MAKYDLKTDARGVCPEFDFEVETSDAGFLEQRDGTRVFIGEAMGYQQPRRYTLQWDNATPGEVFLVEDLFRKAGTTAAMNYIPPDEVSIVEVLFTAPISILQKSVAAYSMQFTVEEAF